MFLRVNLSDEIREARSSANLTQQEFADKIGVSTRTVQGWEAGDVLPQPRHRRALVSFLEEQKRAAA